MVADGLGEGVAVAVGTGEGVAEGEAVGVGVAGAVVGVGVAGGGTTGGGVAGVGAVGVAVGLGIGVAVGSEETPRAAVDVTVGAVLAAGVATSPRTRPYPTQNTALAMISSARVFAVHLWRRPSRSGTTQATSTPTRSRMICRMRTPIWLCPEQRRT